MFGYVAAFMYEGDTPLAERRAAALTLDTALLSELLGQTSCANCSMPVPSSRSNANSSCSRRNDAPAAWRTSRICCACSGPLTDAELEERGVQLAWAEELLAARRVDPRTDRRRRAMGRRRGRRAGCVTRSASRCRSAAESLLAPVADPLADLVSRYARTHGPFVAADVAARLGLGVAVVDAALAVLLARGRLVRGELRPGSSGLEFCDADVLRQLRRRSVAGVAPRSRAGARRDARWCSCPRGSTSVPDGGALRRTGRRPARRRAAPRGWRSRRRRGSRSSSRHASADYNPAFLDELTNAGEVLWFGRGAARPAPTAGCRSRLLAGVGHPDLLPLRSPTNRSPALEGRRYSTHSTAAPHCSSATLSTRVTDVAEPAGRRRRARTRALWDLVWEGRITNDTRHSPACAAAWRSWRSTGRSRQRRVLATGGRVDACRLGPPWPPEADRRRPLAAGGGCPEPERDLTRRTRHCRGCDASTGTAS